MEKATFAGGCFWGMEDLFRKLDGVVDTEVGYAGGVSTNVGYHEVKTGTTGHAEALQITYEPKRISYLQLLDFFFRIHDPTTVDQQGNDRGSQYRSAIFFHSVEQKAAAEKMKALVDESGAWKRPAVTQIVPYTTFVLGEADHQDYLERNPNGYTCHYVRRLPSFLQ